MKCPSCKENSIEFSMFAKNIWGVHECPKCGGKSKMGLLGWLIIAIGISPLMYFVATHIAGSVDSNDLASSYRYMKYGELALLALSVPFFICASIFGLKKVSK